MIINETEKTLKFINFSLEQEVYNLKEVVTICDSINSANESKIISKDNVINSQGFYIVGQDIEIKKLREELDKQRHIKKSIIITAIPSIIISFFAGSVLIR